ncbi:hypothetical protein [Ferrovibrio sp.]|uniref:hypothetical protein n=1 Tax=Ferrovibrio sp. TaxID=1917215 RepID=UPI002619D3A6|nr:hypothetical protein [Ferrovibrio sp.]
MPNSRISFTPMGTFISSSPIAKATPNAKGDETVNSFQQMLAQANSGQPNTSPVLDMRLLNALMNSQQSKYFVEDNSGQLMTSLSAGNIGNHFNFSQIQSQL